MRVWLRRWLPSPDDLRRRPILRWLGPLLDRPWLWAVNRHAVSRGMAIGLFFGVLLPIGQAIAAGALAVWVRANLPVAVAATLVSNPFTTPPIVAGAYYLGAATLGVDPGGPTVEGLTVLERSYAVAAPLAAGLAMLATAAGTAGFILVQAMWRIAPFVRRMRRRRAPA